MRDVLLICSRFRTHAAAIQIRNPKLRAEPLVQGTGGPTNSAVGLEAIIFRRRLRGLQISVAVLFLESHHLHLPAHPDSGTDKTRRFVTQSARDIGFRPRPIHVRQIAIAKLPYVT